MPRLELNAYAKINVSLDVLGKREDGYHDLRMIMQTVGLHDTVLLETIPEGIRLECGSRWVPEDGTNTAWKAAELLMNSCGIKGGISIRINKRIPVAAGLAGGSSDAAAVLKGMNRLFGLGLEQDQLQALGRQVGADVPYCIAGGTKLAEGIGEQLTELPDFSGVDIVLVKPRIGVSTAWVFKNLDLSVLEPDMRPDTELLTRFLKDRNIEQAAKHMRNVLETVTIPRYPAVQQAKDKLMELGALGSMMSGSGPTAFGIFPDRRTADHAVRKLSVYRDWQCFRTYTSKAL